MINRLNGSGNRYNIHVSTAHVYVNYEGVIAQEKRLKGFRSEMKPSTLEIFAVINNFVHVCTLSPIWKS